MNYQNYDIQKPMIATTWKYNQQLKQAQSYHCQFAKRASGVMRKLQQTGKDQNRQELRPRCNFLKKSFSRKVGNGGRFIITYNYFCW